MEDLKRLTIVDKMTDGTSPMNSKRRELLNRNTEFGVKVKTSVLAGKLREHNIPINKTAAIVDFEEDFMMGIMIRDTLFTFYIEERRWHYFFCKCVLKTLRVLQDAYLFSFSDYDKNIVLLMYEDLEIKGYNMEKYEFVKHLRFCNLQETPFESLSQALCKLNIEKTHDPLFRNLRLISELYKMERFDEIVAHNRNCLLNEALLLKKRYLIKNRFLGR